MNVCDDRHEVKYQITYKPAQSKYYTHTKSNNYKPVWLVCASCMETKDHFGSEDEIVSIEVMT